MDGSRILFAAHRGDKFNYPENTVPAFKSALDFGVDMIETDIRMTKDGTLVIIHDRSTLRTAGVDKNVDELTLEEIKALDAGCTFEKPIKAEIPTVREFLELIKNTNMMVNWELKVYPVDFGDEVAFEVADKLIALIEEYNMAEKSMLNSFSSRNLEYLYKKYNHKYLLHGQGIHKFSRACDKTEIDEKILFDWCCVYPDSRGLDVLDFKENFDYCVNNNMLPCLCLPDTVENYKKALEYGCKMFTSNNIIEGDRVMRELGVR